MENEFYNDDFEQLIKQKADQFRMYPSRRVWHSIYNNLHPSRRWPSFAMSILLLGSLTLIGYLHTGENSLTRKMNGSFIQEGENPASTINSKTNTSSLVPNTNDYRTAINKRSTSDYLTAFEDVIKDNIDFNDYTVVRNNRPEDYFNSVPGAYNESEIVANQKQETENTGNDIVQTMDRYIKTNQIFVDIPVSGKKKKPVDRKSGNPADAGLGITNEGSVVANANPKTKTSVPDVNLAVNETPDKKVEPTTQAALNIPGDLTQGKKLMSADDKAWIENFAMHNKPAGKNWKKRFSYQVYATPAVNYRKLSTKSKGSAAPFATADINNNIKQTPGIGMEIGAGLNYSLTKDVMLKMGVQFNYTNYNIDADQTSHPIITTILLNDPATGYSYTAARTSTTANSYNSTALSPVTLHNRTYQISLPIGFAYKLSSHNNVDWFAGATVQPTYVFGGKAHLLSSDLKSYVSDPSSINPWNLSLGFETFMNFKLGAYSIQAGPQVRYQVYSTYRKNVALVEKPYAIGLKLGLTKGF